VLCFENCGTQDTPILENIQAVDVALATGNDKNPARLNELRGDSCSEESFTPFSAPLPVKQAVRLGPTGGRSSAVSAFPFFDLEYGRQGLVAAVGWSGQWAASFDRSEQSPTRFQAGMEQTHLLLHPGERIRTPRILLLQWQGERRAALNRFRRRMLFHYVPQWHDKPVLLPVVMQCFDRYSWNRSDTSCSPGHPEWNQVQTLGLSQYIPFHTACVWTPDSYDIRSGATADLPSSLSLSQKPGVRNTLSLPLSQPLSSRFRIGISTKLATKAATKVRHRSFWDRLQLDGRLLFPASETSSDASDARHAQYAPPARPPHPPSDLGSLTSPLLNWT